MKILQSIFTRTFALLGAALCWGFAPLAAQQTPGVPQEGAIRITGATLHIGNGEVIEQGVLDFDKGVLTYIGESANAPSPGGMKVIDGSGSHIYPGIIAPCNTLGLVEVGQVRASVDQDEVGDFIPHVRSLIAYNAESRVVESMRPNGVLITQTTPVGGVISGTSSIVQLDAWNWEDAVISKDDGIHLNWPSSFQRSRWWLGEAPGLRPNPNYGESVRKIDDYLAAAKAYNTTSGAVYQQDFEAMMGVLNGYNRVYLYADGAREIQDGVNTLRRYGVEKIVLVGGDEAPRIVGFLKRNNVPVLVSETHRLPGMDDEDYDYPYRLPKILHEAGLLVGLQNSGMDNWQSRNLPFLAGQLLSQGVDPETALSFITLNNAKILGIADRYGSLEKGKSATFFVSEGIALEVLGNKLSHAFIDGRELSLETHQTELWKRYMGKYGQPVKD